MTLEERVARMEKQNRRLKVGLGLLALVVAAGVAMGATKKAAFFGETVEAQTFIVKDKRGKRRILMTAALGGAHLEFFDGTGTTRIVMAVEPEKGVDWSGRERSNRVKL